MLSHISAGRRDWIRRPRVRYGISVALVVLASLLRWALPGVLAGTPYLAFYPAVVVAAVFGGSGPGIVATVGSFLCFDLLFDATPGGIDLSDPVVLGRAALFLTGGIAISFVAERLRAARTREQRQARELDWVVESAPNAFVMADADGRIVLVNAKAENLFGYRREELIGQPVEMLMPEPFRARHCEDRRQFMADPQTRPMGAGRDLWAKRKDGSKVPVEIGLSPIRTDKGMLVLASIVDISERKRAEEALRESEGRLTAFLQHLPGAAWIKDMEGRYIYANPEGERIFETPLEQLRGKTDEEVFPPNTARQFRENDRRVLQDGGSIETTEVLRQADGVDHHSIVSKFAVPGPNGRPAYVAGVAFDITARRQAEQSLRESEEQFRTFFESAAVGAVQVDPATGRYLRANERFCRITGYDCEEVQAMVFTEITHPEDRQEDQEQFRRLLSGDSPEYDLEKRYVRKDGKVVWVHVWAALIRDVNGKPLRTAGIVQDITDRKQAEEGLQGALDSARQAEAAAEQANRAKDHFLAVLSHELRTPLTPVVMGVSMLQKRSDLAPEIQETLEMVRRNVEMEARLIDDLLDVTRISRGKIALRRTAVELDTVIQRAVEVCKPDLEARGLHFGMDLGTAASYWVDADVPRLQQVFWNLLKNAIKFTPHDGCVGIRCRPREEYVVAEVNDSGIGFEPEVLPRIFNAFEQGDRSITRQFGGLGLGLAISKALVEMHGGTIEAHSEGRNKGATFRIRLPLRTPDGQSEISASAATVERTVQPLRILVVEDHGVTAKMIRMALTAEGHRVETAGDLATALELASQYDFDLLVSDLGLPDGTGHDLIRQLRERGHEFPGIAVSGYGQPEDVQRSQEAGFAAHLTKPASRELLLEAIASAIATPPTTVLEPTIRTDTVRQVERRAFDADTALRQCFGRPDLLQEMMDYFLAESPEVLDRLRLAAEQDDAAEVAASAHRLMGTLAFLGATNALEVAREVQQIGRSGDLSAVVDAIAQLEHQVAFVREAVLQNPRAARE